MAKKMHDTELTIEQLTQRAAKVRDLLAQARALCPEAHLLSADDRATSPGKMGVEESKALASVVDAMDLEPATFKCLADEDDGHDPNKLETDLLRDRFARQQIYASMAQDCGELQTVFSDTALAIGALCKPVARAGYEIAKPISKRDAAMREKIAPALNYYGGNAQKGAAARKKNQEDKATK